MRGRKRTGSICTCRLCGKEFYVKKSRIDAGCGVFCSRKCQRYVNPNEIRICGSFVEMQVENKSRKFSGVVIFDLEDLERITFLGRKWFAAWHQSTQQFYAASNDKIKGIWTVIILHRFLLRNPPGLDIDHINHNMLDCRRSNLRVCTRGENLQNRRGAMSTSKSGIRGVWFDNSRQKWTAELKINRKKIFVGRFESKTLAEESIKEARSRYMTHSAECD